jgi:octaprenyl-diphosphate synthase
VDPLVFLRTLVDKDMTCVDALIESEVENEVHLIPDISGHTVASGGKRLRPMLTIACAHLCGYVGQDHIALATSVEFMHTATLLHDDVVDSSPLRRGNETANQIWGNKASVLVGDYLLGKAFNLMVKPKSVRILEILSRAAMVISEGEVLQLSCEGTLPEDEKTYIRIINAKTAELFAAACEISAVLAERPQEECVALREYGLHLGRSFQIADDALDYCASKEVLGKQIGEDFKDRKATLPLIYAYKEATTEEKIFWQRTIVDGNQNENDYHEAMRLMHHYNAVEYALDYAQKQSQKACDLLSSFPNSAYRQALESIARFACNRRF